MAKEIIEVPISGKITTVEAKVGDKVAEGDTICFLESMKMENAILAPVAGVVKEIKVSPNQSVEGGEIICVIEY